MLESMAASVSMHVLSAVLRYWKDMIYLTAIAFGLCFLVMILLQFFTRVLVVLCLLLGIVGSLLVTIFLWINYAIANSYVTENKLKDSLNKTLPATDQVLAFVEQRIEREVEVVGQVLNVTTPDADALANLSINMVEIDTIFDILAFDLIKNSEYLLPWSIFSTVITTITILILFGVRKSLYLVIKIFDEASIAVISMPVLLFEPVKSLIAYTMISVYFFVVSAFIITIQDPMIADNGFVFYDEKNGTSITGVFFVHLFGCLWILQFISGCQQIIIAGTISNWFFIRGEKRLARKGSVSVGSFVIQCTISPTLRATADLFLYHLGTVSFGSLIIGIVQTLRVGLAFVQRNLQGRESELAKKVIQCLRCCLVCFEKFMKYINRNAYICAAMYGSNFFQSGKRALTLLIDNAQHALALNCISAFCNFIGKLAVVAITIFISVGYFKYYRLGADALLAEYFVPLLAVAVVSYLIAHGFFTVYDTALDTIFLCFCDDQQRNNGDDRPYYSSVRLQNCMKGGANRTKSTKNLKQTPDVSAGTCTTSEISCLWQQNNLQIAPKLPLTTKKFCSNDFKFASFPQWTKSTFVKKIPPGFEPANIEDSIKTGFHISCLSSNTTCLTRVSTPFPKLTRYPQPALPAMKSNSSQGNLCRKM